ncbi:APC family permease [Novosphingobium sp. B-7]|uniref:APC family permease n=1 Tax=Novosphingobium sp. B-7 TaxID=1298855 RepID=UPI0009E5F9F1|nr:APC family permease [Novosphingobium sp. B-7]
MRRIKRCVNKRLVRDLVRKSGPALGGDLVYSVKTSSGLLRVLGTAFALAVGLGNMVGSGIFRSPGNVIAQTGSVRLAVLLIVAVGAQSLLSANLWAEVSTAIGLSGGSVVVARRAFGDTAAMVIGWTDALSCIAGTAQAAAGAPIFLAIVWPIIAPDPRLSAAILLIVFSLINWRGVVAGERTQMTASLVQAALVIGIIVLLFVVAPTAAPVAALVPAKAPIWTAGGLIIGYQLVYGTYVGWNNAAYFAEETADPGRTVPRALGWSVIAFGALYVGMLLGLGHALPLAKLSGAAFPAQLALGSALGTTGIRILSAVAFATLVVCMNSGIMPGTRVLFALGKASYAPRFLTSVNAGGTPDLALLAFAGVAVLLVLTGRYETIFMLMGTLALAVTAAMDLAFFQLRRREPELNRPYRAIGYPFLPALALFMDLAILLMIALSDVRSTCLGLLIAGAGGIVALMLSSARRGRERERAAVS